MTASDHSKIALTRRRRRPPSKKLVLALAWIVFDLCVLAWSVILISRGHGNDPMVLVAGCLAIVLVPWEWATLKKELDRWKDG